MAVRAASTHGRPRAFEEALWPCETVRAASPQRLRAFVEALWLCGLPARLGDSEPSKKPCGRARPCGLPACSDSEPLWKPCGCAGCQHAWATQSLRRSLVAVRDRAGCQPAATQSLCGSLVAVLAASTLPACSDSEPLWKPCGCAGCQHAWATQSLRRSLVAVRDRAGCQPAATQSLCGSLVAVRAASTHGRLRAFEEALWPCETVRAASPQRLRAFVAALWLCGLPARMGDSEPSKKPCGRARPCGLPARSLCGSLVAVRAASTHGRLRAFEEALWPCETVRAASPQRLRAFVEAFWPCGLPARMGDSEPSKKPCGRARPCGLPARSDSEPLWKPCGCVGCQHAWATQSLRRSLVAVRDRAGCQPAATQSLCGSLVAVRAASTHGRLRAFEEALWPCETVRAASPQRLRAFMEALWLCGLPARMGDSEPSKKPCGRARPCGLPARSDSEPLWKPCGCAGCQHAWATQSLRRSLVAVRDRAGCQPAATQSLCGSLVAVRAASTHGRLRAFEEALWPCETVRAASPRRLRAFVEAFWHRAGCQPAATQSLCGSLVAVRAASTHGRLRAFEEALWPCETVRAASPQRLRAFVEAFWPCGLPARMGDSEPSKKPCGRARPCGLPARSDSEPLWKPSGRAGCQGAATQSLCGSLETVRAASKQRHRAFVEALWPRGLPARMGDSEPLWKCCGRAGCQHAATQPLWKPCGCAGRATQWKPCGRAGCQPAWATQSLCGSLETVRVASPHGRLRAFVEALRPCGLPASSDSEPLWKP